MFLLCEEVFHWSITASDGCIYCIFFVSLFHFMNQVKFLPKSSPSASLTRDRHTTLFSLILSQPKLVWRGDGEQKRKWIYQVAVHLKISLCFQEHTMQDKVVKTGRQRQAPSSLPFTWRGPFTAARMTNLLMRKKINADESCYSFSFYF